MKAGSVKRLQTPVLIVGGGPSGMTAALCLAACGVGSVIIEKRQTLARHPKAHEISARTIEILVSLGISMRQMIKESSPHEDASRILFCRTLGEELGRIDLGEKDIAAKYAAHTHTERPYLNLSQTELEKILRQKVLRSNQIRLFSGWKWRSLRQSPDGVASIAQNVASGAALEIHSQYLLCCDGAGGACRSQLGITMQGPEKIQDFANAYFTDDLRSRLKTKAKLFFVLKPDAAGTFIAHHAGRRWVYHVPVMTPHEKIEDYTEEVFRERIARALGDADFKPHIESVSSWRMTAQIATTFQNGRCFLVGDSAHRFPPTGGLGLNSGVGDAHNLAWKIAAIIRDGASESLAATYETERKPVVTLNCDESRRNFFKLYDIPRALGINPTLLPRAMALLSSVPLRWFGRKFRDAALRLLYALADRRLQRRWQNPRVAARLRTVIEGQHEHFDRIGLDLGYVYNDGAIVSAGERAQFSGVADYRPSFSPGARLPVFRWRSGKATQQSADVLRYDRFTIFAAAADASAWKAAVTAARLKPKLQVIALPDTIFTAGHSKATRNILSGGALLVRPDGHIAAQVEASAPALQQVFEQLGYNVKPALPARRLAS